LPWLLLLGVVLLAPLASCARRSVCAACAYTGPATTPSTFVLPDRAALIAALSETFARQEHGLSVLWLSGGGAYGAWGAGVLQGWSQSGTRPPHFALVIGISTGSLQATYAFLGSAYDEGLKQAYTNISNHDIFRRRWWLTVPFSSSLRITDPLQATLAHYITDDMIDQVGQTYLQERRRLLVSTVDLAVGSIVTWDLTAIAASTDAHRYAYYRQILLAATAIPVVFPPVLLNGAIHVDGSVRNQVFGLLVSHALSAAGPTGPQNHFFGSAGVGSRQRPGLYVIGNSKLTVPQRCLEEHLLPLAGRTNEVLLSEGLLGSLSTLKSTLSAWQFQLSRIPDDYPLSSDPQDFDQVEMNALFEVGRRWGREARWEADLPQEIGPSPLPCGEAK
jgi:predicted patatin/cPLA2 family phospholipase